MHMPSKPIRRAVEVIASHASVRDVRVKDGDLFRLEIDFEIPMPSRWRGVGRSPSGVYPIETVSFTFHDAFPLVAPRVELRADFDRSHPHIYPGPADQPPQPCYFDGDPSDLLRFMGMEGIVRQVSNWLEKAATSSLMDPDRWEPVRRDRIDDWVEVDSDFVRSLANDDGGFAFATLQYVSNSQSGGDAGYAATVESLKLPLSLDSFNKIIARAGSFGLSIVLWPGKDVSGKPFTADRYLPETVGSLRELAERASGYGLRAQMSAAMNLVRQRLGRRTLEVPLLICFFLISRRPRVLKGTASPLEILPYLACVHSAAELSESSDHPARPAAVREAVSRKLLLHVSGAADLGNKEWTLIGCGSLGSKLGIHLAREGRGPTHLVDRSYLFPHNYARHGLHPLPFVPVPEMKAFALANILREFGQPARPFHWNIVSAVVEPSNSLAKLWPAGAEFVVDATASPTVSDTLCTPQVTSVRPRVIEVSLFGSGSVGRICVEGPSVNPNLLDLQAESLRLMAGEAQLRGLALQAEGEIVTVGQGCSTYTARMTDAKLSVFAPAMSRRISQALEEGLPADGGELSIGVIDDQLMNQSWQKISIPSCHRIGEPRGGWISISARVLVQIDEAIAVHRGVETGGVLIGRYNETTDSFHVVDLIAPPPDSRFTASEFTLGVQGLAEEISSYCKRANGALYAVGTWHNHLSDTSASITDLATASALALGQRFPVALVIRTPDTLRAVIAEADRHNERPAVIVRQIEAQGSQ